jgi:hypothetical protein
MIPVASALGVAATGVMKPVKEVGNIFHLERKYNFYASYKHIEVKTVQQNAPC